MISAERDQHLHADGALGALRLLRERHRGEGRDGAGAAAGVPRRGAGGYPPPWCPRGPGKGLQGYSPLGSWEECLGEVFLGALLPWETLPSFRTAQMLQGLSKALAGSVCWSLASSAGL